MLRFEKHNLSSYSGMVVFQELFTQLGLSARLSKCSPRHCASRHSSYSLLFRLLIVNVLLGMRKLRDIDHYREDPIVLRTLGVSHLPSVPTISRMLDTSDGQSVSELQKLSTGLVIERLAGEGLSIVTLDFDGSVISTGRKAEGSAVGFNKGKKGARSYYPLFCTVAQSGQILDVLHRNGNVHDSNGAVEFVEACVLKIRHVLPRACIEIRMDSAFFNDAIIQKLEALHVQYAISVPFERFHELKGMIEGRKRWKKISDPQRKRSAFEKKWKPQSWNRTARFLFVRTENPKQRKGPLQLDLFEPVDFGYDYKCVVTNKECSIKAATLFLEGRGSQENVFAELKSQGALAYVPCTRQTANQCYMLCAIIAHNLCRELQMRTWDRLRENDSKRPALWVFQKIQTLRNSFICKAGRFSRPSGIPTLTLNADSVVEMYLKNYFKAA